MRISSAATNALNLSTLLRSLNIRNTIEALAGDQIIIRVQDYRQVADALYEIEMHASQDVKDAWVIEPCDIVLDLTSR
jgi:hypothetical protein